MKLGELLNIKGRDVYTTHVSDTILEVIKKLVGYNVGALVVLDNDGNLAGIISERDILRVTATGAGNLADLKVRDHMTRDLVTASSEATVDDAQSVMTERRIRHLPVVDNQQLIGMISLGDLVKAKLADAEFETRHLTEFVMGKYPA
ncbi:MAG: CBS domain-containing protein [Calditrichota bacterium]